MRKILMGLMMISLLGTSAQIKFAIGPKAGMSFNTMSDKIDGESLQSYYNDLYSGTDVKARVFNIGFNYGGFAELTLANTISLQAEYQLSGEGTGVKFTEDGESFNDGDNDYTERFKMTNIPLMAKVYVNETVGIYGGIQLSSIREITQRIGTPSPDNKAVTIEKDSWSSEIKEDWQSIIVGFTAEQSGVVVDLRASIGPEIRKNPDTYSQKPMSLYIMIGYKIIGKRG